MVGPVTVTYIEEGAEAPYALITWEAPPGASSPPVHIHHRTDEGFYVLNGTFELLVDGRTIAAPRGAHVLVRKNVPHTFWNAGAEPATCLIIFAPSDFAPYFRELSDLLSRTPSDEEAVRVRKELSARYDIEVIGPPITPNRVS